MATPGAHSQAGAGPDDTPDATQSWSGEKGRASIPRQIGRFQIRARLGAGGFGAVYRAYDPVLDREVALKVPHRERLLSEQDRARVLREAKAAAQLRHANIVPVHDAGVDGHYFYIASAFIEGPTLAKILRGPGVGFREAAKVTMDLAGALQHAHDRGIVHRDVKPGNVMIDSNGTALLTDFGLAHVVESETMLTQEGVVLGTPAYMAPEQARGETNLVGPASDQYSLGVVLYQMLCGRLPFEGPPCAVVARLAHESPPKPRSIRHDVPRELESICLRAMAKSNLDRYASCQAMADDLDRWLRGEGPAAGRPPWDRAWIWMQRHRKPLAMAVGGLALALVLMVALFQVVVRIRHRDGPDTVVRAPAGSEVDIGEDGSVAVTPPPPAPPSERSVAGGPINSNRLPEKAAADESAVDDVRPADGPTAEDEANADRLVRQLESTLGTDDFLRSHFILETLDRQFADTTAMRAAGPHIERYREQIAEGAPLDKKEEFGQYWILPHSPEARDWANIMKFAASLASAQEGDGFVGPLSFAPREDRAIAVIRILLEDESVQDESSRCLIELGIMDPPPQYHDVPNWSELLRPSPPISRENALREDAGFRHSLWNASWEGSGSFFIVWYARRLHPEDPPMPRIQRVGIRAKEHYEIRLPIAFEWGKAVAIGNVVLRRVPDDQRGRLAVRLQFTEDVAPGRHHVTYTGRGADGSLVLDDQAREAVSGLLPAGQYTIRLKTGGPGSAESTTAQVEPERTSEVELQVVRQRVQYIENKGPSATSAAAFSSDLQRIVWLCGSSTVEIVDLENEESSEFQLPKNSGGGRGVVLCPDDKLVAAQVANGETVFVCDAQTGRVNWTAEGAQGNGIVQFSPDGKILAVEWEREDLVRLFDAHSGKEGPSLKAEGQYGTVSLAFSPEGKHLATNSLCRGQSDSVITVWDVSTGAEVFSVPADRGPLAYSGDGKWIATAPFNGGPTKLLDAHDGEVKVSLPGNSDPVRTLAFIPNGEWLICAGGETVRLWDVGKWQERARIPISISDPAVSAFSPDGNRIGIVGGYGRSAAIVNVSDIVGAYPR
jgi:WD40 repeat protein